MYIGSLAPLEFQGNDLAGFSVVAKACTIRHADEFVFHNWLGDLKGFRDIAKAFLIALAGSLVGYPFNHGLDELASM